MGGVGEDLGGEKGCKTITRIYYMKKMIRKFLDDIYFIII